LKNIKNKKKMTPSWGMSSLNWGVFTPLGGCTNITDDDDDDDDNDEKRMFNSLFVIQDLKPDLDYILL